MRPSRREFIQSRISASTVTILELGAMDSPTFPELNCRYLDWFSQEELQASLADNPNRIPDRVVAPDYVVKQKLFAAAVSRKFDVVIANHVMEHVADPIRWLCQIEELTEPNSNLFLALPDRRFTFDYLRPVSTAADLVRAFDEDLEQPSRWQMLESSFYHRPVRAGDFWDGGFEAKLEQRRMTLDQALEASHKADREYVDVHCHVFEFGSFPALIEDLTDGGFIGWRVSAIRDVERDDNEFCVHLVRADR